MEEKPATPNHVLFQTEAVLPTTVEEIDQSRKVLEFRKAFPDQGLYWTFRNWREFEEFLRGHLANFVRNLGGPGPGEAKPILIKLLA